LETTLDPIAAYHEETSDVFLDRGENIFVKEICTKLWNKLNYRLGRLEDNVFEGSELSEANSHSA
jgi:hypothetical protein